MKTRLGGSDLRGCERLPNARPSCVVKKDRLEEMRGACGAAMATRGVKTIDRRGHVEPGRGLGGRPEPSSGRRSLDRRRAAGNAAEPNPIGLSRRRRGGAAYAAAHKVTNAARDMGRSVTNPLGASSQSPRWQPHGRRRSPPRREQSTARVSTGLASASS